MAIETSQQLKMASTFEVKLSSFLQWKGRRSSKQYMNDIRESTSAKTELDTMYTGLESTQTSNVSFHHAQHANVSAHMNHDSCSSQHWPQNIPWQLLITDYFHFGRSEYLVVTDYYSKMPIIRRIPTPQCNASKTISVLKELFAEHGIPEVLLTDNGPQFANAFFTKFTTDWKYDCNTSSPRNPRSNGQAEAAIKTIKRLLPHAKCSGQDPYLAVLPYCSMSIDAHLHSPTEMLYQWVLHTTVPQWIRHADPPADAEHDHLNQHATQSAEYNSQWGCCKKPPFFASQTISVLNDARNLWLPAIIFHKANNGSYLV